MTSSSPEFCTPINLARFLCDRSRNFFAPTDAPFVLALGEGEVAVLLLLAFKNAARRSGSASAPAMPNKIYYIICCRVREILYIYIFDIDARLSEMKYRRVL